MALIAAHLNAERDAAGQRTGFNTLDNWGHKTPTQSKKEKDRKERLKGHGPKHVYNTLGYTKTGLVV